MVSKKFTQKIIKSLRLRTWVSLGVLLVLFPLTLFSVFYWDSLLAALGGSSATPIAHWALDEGQGTTANDSSSNQKNADINSLTWITEDQCVSGKCLYSDPTGVKRLNATDTGGSDLLDFGTTDFSISFWGKPLSYTYPESLFPILDGNGPYIDGAGHEGWSVGDGHHATGVQININDGTNRVTSNVNFDTGVQPNDLLNKWTHFIYVFDRETNDRVYIYINGILQTNSVNISSVTGSISNSSNLFFGYGTGWKTHGFIDEVKIFDSALTAAQIKAEFAGGAAVLGTQDNKDFLSDGLIAYFPSENNVSGNGQTISDTSGNATNATTNDGANDTGMNCTVAGKFGFGCNFDGVDDSLTLGTQYSLGADGTYPNFTLAAWVNADSKTTQTIFGTNQNLGGLQYDGTSIEFGPGASSGQAIWTSARPSYSTWHHVAVTVKGTTAELFIDGATQGTKDISTFTQYWGTVNERIFFIGKDFAGNDTYFDGSIDDARIYGRSLSPSEVKALYNWAPGPVGYWKMDEGTGTTFNDSSSNSIGGTLPAATWRDGKYGKAATFAGGTAVANLSSDSDLHDWINDITVEGWVYYNANPAPGSPEYFFLKGNPFNNSGVGYSLNYGNSILSAYYNDGQNPASNCPSVGINIGDISNQWTHIAAVFKKSTTSILIYKNGDLVTTGTPACTGNFNSSTATKLGGVGSSNGMNGSIDDVRIYNYARTPQQIVEDMNAGHPTGGSPVGSQIAYWKFDEMSGDTAYDTLGSFNGDLGDSDTTCPTSGADCPTWTASGKFNSALTFDGTDDFLEIADNAVFKPGTNDYSISGWFKRGVTMAENEFIFAKQGDGTSDAYDVILTTGGIIRSRMGLSTIESNTSINLADSTWHHFVVSVDRNGNGQVYIDGNASGTAVDLSSTSDNLNNTDVVLIGKRAIGGFFEGQIDEVKFYSSALTSEQAKIDYTNGRAINFGGGVDGSADTIDGAVTPPVGHWTFDEKVDDTCGSSNDVCDKSGNGNNGAKTSMSATNWSPGKYGAALTYDGSDDRVVITDPASGILDFGTGTMSVSAWVKTTSTNQSQIIDKKSEGSNTAGYNLQFAATGEPYFRVANGSAQAIALTSGSPINDGKWHHVVGTLERGTPNAVKIYVDGMLKASTTPAADGWNIDSIRDVEFGRSNAATLPLSGSIDEVKIFNYALTPAQVAYEFNQGAPIAWFKFDECTGSTVYDQAEGGTTNLTINIGATGSNTTTGTCSSATGTEMWNNGTTGKFGSAIDFDGTDDYANYAGQIAEFPLTQVSFSAWINPDTTSSTHVVMEQISGVFEIDRSTTTWSILVINASGTPVSVAGGTATAGTWTHVMGTYDGANVNLYVNGKLVNQAAQTGLLRNTTNHFVLGCDGNTSNVCLTYFAGQVDDVRIYAHALSSEQVKREFNEGRSVRFQ